MSDTLVDRCFKLTDGFGLIWPYKKATFPPSSVCSIRFRLLKKLKYFEEASAFGLNIPKKETLARSAERVACNCF
jgi:hypothetical protein